ncbi:MAG: GNAT family N-acetyltransferase [Acidobacteria bacterium]|nr:GNAT family N-acetyltransferase [Acidobacteriota bacterium]
MQTKSKQLTLRPYDSGDFNSLYALDQECFQSGISYSKRDLRAYLGIPTAECLIAECDNEIAGFILTTHDSESATIITLDVAAKFRRRGVGTLLLESAEHNLKTHGVRQVEIETSTEDSVAVAFWQHHGYRTRGVLQKYYDNRIDAYAMTKQL